MIDRRNIGLVRAKRNIKLVRASCRHRRIVVMVGL